MERNKPTPGEKGQYGYVRKPEEKARRAKRKVRDGEPGASTDELDFIAPPVLAPASAAGTASASGSVSVSAPPSAHAGMPPPVFSTVLYDPRLGPPPPFPPPPPAHIPPPEVVAARQHAMEEEDDETEWRIREGQGTQPQWARRAEEEEEPPRKRQRVS